MDIFNQSATPPVTFTGNYTGYRCICGEWVSAGSTSLPHAQFCQGAPKTAPVQSVVTTVWSVDQRVLDLLERIANALEGRPT